MRPAPERAVAPTRLYLTLPTGITRRQFGNDLAVAPDGKTLAYVARSQRAVPALFVKAGSDLDAVEVPGTGGAVGPFFSPDGSQVGFIRSAFFAGGLEVISLSGGAPQVLVDSGVAASSAVWGADGFIYFAAVSVTGGSTAIRRIRERGGPVEELLSSDSATALGSTGTPHVFPLPNGKGLLFTIWDPNGRSQVAVLDLRSGAVVPLMRGMRPVHVRTGHVIYSLDDAILAVPFDQDRFELTGPAVTLIPQVSVDRAIGSGEFAVSDAGTLAYLQPADSGNQTVVRIDMDGAVVPIDPGWNAIGVEQPALSPDGRRLVVSVDGSIWVKVLDRGPLTRLTFGEATDSRPMWHPDGRHILFYRNRGALSDTIYVRSADGTGTEQVLVADELGAADARWSPDGQWIVYRTSMESSGGGDIKLLRVGDSTAITLLGGSYGEMTPQLAPDGRWLAYASNESGRYEVYVRPFPNVDEGRWQISSGGGTQPRWSREGRQLFYRSDDDAMMAAEVTTRPGFTPGTVRRLFSTASFDIGVFAQMDYDVLPDGGGFVTVSSPSGESDPVVMVFDWFDELRTRVLADR
jgi:serine/threonine-protein kinase